MADETEQQVIVPAPLETTKLNSVSAIREWWEPGVYFVECNVTVPGLGTIDYRHSLRPEDDSELGQQLAAWMQENPDFPVTPYTPPTEEQIRQSMPALTARQFRLGLVNASISPSQVSATIAVMPAGPDKDKAQIEWEYATTFNRMHPLIATVGAALGLNDTQIDAMWTAAVSL